MEISLHDLTFCIRLMMDFPFACDHECERMLDDFLIEHYEMPDEQWLRELSGEAGPDSLESDP